MEASERTDAVLAALDQYETALNAAEKAVLDAGKAANAMLGQMKVQLDTAHESIVTAIKNSSAKADEHIDAISAAQKDAINALSTSFEASYAAAIEKANSDWTAMKDSLANEQTPAA